MIFSSKFQNLGGGKNGNFNYRFYDFFDYLNEFSIQKNIYLDKNLTKIGQLQPEKLIFKILTHFRTYTKLMCPYHENR